MTKTYTLIFQFQTAEAAKAAHAQTEGSKLNDDAAEDQTWLTLPNITPEAAFAFHEKHQSELVAKRVRNDYGQLGPYTIELVT